MSHSPPSSIWNQTVREMLARYWILIPVTVAIAISGGAYFGFSAGFKNGLEFSARKLIAIGGVINSTDSRIYSVIIAANQIHIHFDGTLGPIPSTLRIEYTDAKMKKLIKTEVIAVQGIAERKPRIALVAPDHPNLIMIEILPP